jgi:hypothetical protein
MADAKKPTQRMGMMVSPGGCLLTASLALKTAKPLLWKRSGDRSRSQIAAA